MSPNGGAAVTDDIAFNEVVAGGRELDYIAEAIRRGHLSSGGPFTERSGEILRGWLDAPDVLLTTSCTDALEMAALLLDIEPGDSVIVPSMTFVSSALAFVRAGATVRFADIEPTTLGIAPEEVERLADETTKAVVAVHYAGIAVDLDHLLPIVEQRQMTLVEDNAHGLLGCHRDRPLGSFGRFSTLSFHDTKNFVCGEGGALVVNSPDDVARARIIHEKGTDRHAFRAGEIDKYSWRDTGSSFALSEGLAAILTAQLEDADSITGRRRAIFERYDTALQPIAAELGITTPNIPTTAGPGYHLYFVLLPDAPSRSRIIRSMADDGIHATFHYVPLHDSVAGLRFTDQPAQCPVTEDISARLLRLPFHNALTDEDVDRVVDSLRRALVNAR